MYTYPKNFLSVTQLIQKLKDTGMTIDSNDTAEIALTTSGLSGETFRLSIFNVNCLIFLQNEAIKHLMMQLKCRK